MISPTRSTISSPVGSSQTVQPEDDRSPNVVGPDAERKTVDRTTKRKALTEYEASKNLMEMTEAAKEVLREKFSPTVGENSKTAGRPAKPDSEEKVAERIGVPQSTINLAKQHVSAEIEEAEGIRQMMACFGWSQRRSLEKRKHG